MDLVEVRSLPLNVWKTLIQYDLSRAVSPNTLDTSSKVHMYMFTDIFICINDVYVDF
jgi:hypothetical protein